MKRYRIVTCCIVLMFLLVACGQASAPDSTNQSDQTTVELSADQTTDAPTAVVADATPAPEESTVADESDGASWSGDSFANKLDTLDSYTATFTYTTTNNDQDTSWVWQQKVTKNPAAMEMRTNSTGTDVQSADYYLVKIADKTYSVSADPVQCIIVVDQPEAQTTNPDSIIGDIPFSMQKTGAGPDVLGRPTDAYTYEGTEADGSSYQSTALVERNDGYAMRWEVTGKTKNGEALEPFSWKYELTDINTVAPITLPKECENLASGSSWPMPEGSQITMQTNQMVALTSDKSVQELTDFYTTAMKDAGYTPSDGGMNAADTSMLMFTKDDKNITVMISLQEGKGMVIITQQ